MESFINIVDLPFDVLHIIFSELKLKDRINLGLAHSNLGEVFIVLYKKEFCHIDLDELPNRVWHPLFSLCGHIVESLYWFTKSTFRALKFASKYCQSLRKIDFSFERKNTVYKMRRWICKLKNLHTISISNFDNDCTEDTYLNNINGIFEAMAELPNLRILFISHFHPASLTSLRKLTQLERLQIIMSFGFELDIGYICAKLENLRILHYTGSIKDSDSFQALPQFCPLLMSLHILAECEIRVPYFPKLEWLLIASTSTLPLDVTLGGFGLLYAKQLEGLRIDTPFAQRCEDEGLMEELKKIRIFKGTFHKKTPQ